MYTGVLKKMLTKFDEPIEYSLLLNQQKIDMNMLIGANLKVTYLNEIRCLGCGEKTTKSFAQGYCYNCFTSLPETDECILKPELCRAHEGISRDMKWSEAHCLQEHFVYLAISSGLKVGVTRSSQIPTRWIDQGASKAIKLAQTPNRYTAGIIEVELKKYFSDKTSWQKMLKNEIAEEDLLLAKQKASDLLPEYLKKFVINDDTIWEFDYPVLEFPDKVQVQNLDAQPTIEGKLLGIKGQYLMFDKSRVINIRKHGGYKIKLEIV
jgi:hypothetical protein